MKTQEVINIFEKYKNIPTSEVVKTAYDIAISALKKQIPKKPIDDRYPWVICPLCGGSVYVEMVQEHIKNNETTYCEHCGQALDWSDTE